MTEEERKIVFNTRKQEFAGRAAELEALERALGADVPRIVLETRAKETERNWREIAKHFGDNGIDGIINTLWTWVKEEGFEFTAERDGNTAQMKVTRCPIAEMAKELGMEKWGYRCYCCDDPSIVRGFNPRMRFARTKTLMEGADACDHCYELD
jgi:predicted ArsR family transcriptional regulator